MIIKKVLLVVLLLSIGQLTRSQSISGVASRAEHDSLIGLIKKEKINEEVPGLIYLYDMVDTSTILFKVYYATGYNLYGYNYTKSLLNFINFDSICTIYLFNKKEVFGFVGVSGIGMAIGPAMQGHQKIYGKIIEQVDIRYASVFYISGCRNPFVSMEGKLYVFINGTLVDANSYLESRYTLVELANLFNPRY